MKVDRRRLVLALMVVACVWEVLLSGQAKSAVRSSQNEQTVWDGVYTMSQAERGRAVFESECTRCHEISDFVGDDYMTTWDGRTLKDFYLYISSGMPPDLHEEITDFQAYSDILAYVLESNDFPAGEAILSANLDRLELIRVEPMP